MEVAFLVCLIFNKIHHLNISYVLAVACSTATATAHTGVTARAGPAPWNLNVD